MNIIKYTQFLRNKLEIDMDTGMTAGEIQLLEFLTTFSDNGMPLCVGGAMKLERFASPATLHRRLRHLINKGYLMHVHENENMRTKFLIPTDKAYKYFKKLDKLLEGK